MPWNSIDRQDKFHITNKSMNIIIFDVIFISYNTSYLLSAVLIRLQQMVTLIWKQKEAFLKNWYLNLYIYRIQQADHLSLQ